MMRFHRGSVKIFNTQVSHFVIITYFICEMNNLNPNLDDQISKSSLRHLVHEVVLNKKKL